MSAVEIVFFQETEGVVPVWDWLQTLKRRNRKAFAKCVVRIGRLADEGHELRRPEADYLRDGIYELRIREGRVQYRILYSFHNREIAVLSCGLTKVGRVPPKAIEDAIERMNRFRARPDHHTFVEDPSDG